MDQDLFTLAPDRWSGQTIKEHCLNSITIDPLWSSWHLFISTYKKEHVYGAVQAKKWDNENAIIPTCHNSWEQLDAEMLTSSCDSTHL